MSDILKSIKRKLASIVLVLLSTSAALFFLAAMVVWVPFLAQIVVGLLILVVAFVFGFLGLKFLAIKQEIDKFFKL